MDPEAKEKKKRSTVVRRNFVYNGKSRQATDHIQIDLENPKASDHGEVYTFTVSQVRYQSWLRVAKIRYWLDLGEREDFLVNWQDVKDVVGVTIERIVKICQFKDGESSATSLFILTFYETKCKIMIQGMFRDQWVSREFPILQGTVDLIEKGMCPSEAYKEISEVDLVISENDLDLSDNESESPENRVRSDEEIDCIEIIDSAAKNTKAKGNIISSPLKRRSPKQRNSVKSKVSQDNRQLDTAFERIFKLEGIIAELENVSASQRLEVIDLEQRAQQITRDITLEVRNKFDDFKVSMKHDLAVNRQQSKQELDSLQAFASNLEAENKKLVAKVTSLQDYQNNLMKKIKVIEENNAVYIASQKTMEKSLHNLENVARKCELLEQNVAILESQLASTGKYEGEASHVLNHGLFPSMESMANPADHTIPGYNGSILRNIPKEVNKQSVIATHESEKFRDDVIMLMDSNRKFINTKGIFPRQKTAILKCGNLESAKNILKNPRFTQPKAIIIHVGVNDVEATSVKDICEGFREVVDLATESFPLSHIYISEVTPRNDSLQEKVQEVNHFLSSGFTKDNPAESRITVIRHPNLNVDCLFDCKHLSKAVGVKKLVINIKRALDGNNWSPKRRDRHLRDHQHAHIEIGETERHAAYNKHLRPQAPVIVPAPAVRESDSHELHMTQLVQQLQSISSALLNKFPATNPAPRQPLQYISNPPQVHYQNAMHPGSSTSTAEFFYHPGYNPAPWQVQNFQPSNGYDSRK